MRIEELAFTLRYRAFDVGERIRRQDTGRAWPFPDGVHVVTRFEAPKDEGNKALVWIEGHDWPFSTYYLTAAEDE